MKNELTALALKQDLAQFDVEENLNVLEEIILDHYPDYEKAAQLKSSLKFIKILKPNLVRLVND